MKTFGIYIIGDEILSGKRQDAHLSFAVQALKARGLQLAWANYLGDIPEQITSSLKASMARADVVFSFGGIGATPDDFTRQCAADAAGLPIERHSAAVAEIEAQYGESAYPKRVLMADFPQGATLIPNPVNRVAGFAINEHYFVPGFPEMSHPMIFIDLMNHILAKYPDLKLFSLPKLDKQRTTELGVKGVASLVHAAMSDIKQGVTALNFPWTEV